MTVEFVTLSCPTCGGKLSITNSLIRFACGHCGNEHIVIRQGGVIALSPIEEGIRKIQKSSDSTASELAIKRLMVEISEGGDQLWSYLHKELSRSYGDGEGLLWKGLSAVFDGTNALRALWDALKSTENQVEAPLEYSSTMLKRYSYILYKTSSVDLRQAVVLASGSLQSDPQALEELKEFGGKLLEIKNKLEEKEAQLKEHRRRVDLKFDE